MSKTISQMSDLCCRVIILCFVGWLAGCDQHQPEQKPAIPSDFNPVEIKLECPRPDPASSDCKTTEQKISAKSINDYLLSMDCNPEKIAYAWQLNWCLGKKAWQGTKKKNKLPESDYIDAWQYGVISTAHAVSNELINKISKNRGTSGPAKEPFLLGKNTVWINNGGRLYNCEEAGKVAPYQGMWCEGKANFKKSKVYDKNLESLQQHFIDGFIAGRAIALAAPNSVDDLLQKHEEIPALFTKNMKKTIIDNHFEAGYKKGYTLTIEALKSSISEALNDLQLPVDASSLQLDIK